MIAFRTGNICALGMAAIAFYSSLAGLSPQSLLSAFTDRTDKATQIINREVEEILVESEMIPKEQWHPTPTPSPAPTNSYRSPRLVRPTAKSDDERTPSNEAI